MTTSNQGPECPACGYTEYMGDVKIEDGYRTTYCCSNCGVEFHSACSVVIEWETNTLKEMVTSI